MWSVDLLRKFLAILSWDLAKNFAIIGFCNAHNNCPMGKSSDLAQVSLSLSLSHTFSLVKNNLAFGSNFV